MKNELYYPLLKAGGNLFRLIYMSIFNSGHSELSVVG